ncbi:NAD(P)-binding domain-containing protein, partial [Streptomyces phytophilus]
MPADVAVIGLGHHGLPLAQAAAAAGFSVVGYDPDPRA